MLNIGIKNSYDPLSTEELDEILIELRTNGGSSDPPFSKKGGDGHE